MPVLTGEIDRELPPGAKDHDKETLAKRQANAAVALLKMNQPENVWPLLMHRSDPRARSYLIHRFGPLGADAGVLVKRLREEPDVTIRRALILSLGPEEFADQSWTPEAKKVLVKELKEIYRTAPDPGIHAAAEWLLRQSHEGAWLKVINDQWANRNVAGGGCWAEGRTAFSPTTRQAPLTTPRWYVNGQHQTMVVIPGPVQFAMGSPTTEKGHVSNELQHKQRIGRTFAIAATPVTLKQYLAFYRLRFHEDYGYLKQNAPSEDCPVHQISWYMAAEYCNWLSEQEGVPREEWCYEPDTSRSMALLAAGITGFVGSGSGQGPILAACAMIHGGTPSGAYAEGMKLKPDYLKRTGYRMPTEAEWEYACRAEAVTSRYYGESEELLAKYGWYLSNSAQRSWPVGSKKPNDLGLFDMHGNIWVWCQERNDDYARNQGGEPIEDTEDTLIISDKETRVARGGAFGYYAMQVRSAFRTWTRPSNRPANVGIRPARTLPFSPSTDLPSAPDGGRK